MQLTDPEIRVLASLVEKEAAVPESYPLSLNALRLACNQSTNRNPVVTYDDRTVENALLSLKSVGLVRFVHPSHGGRTTRYRHTAAERWGLSPGEALVLSALALRGPQSANEVRARIERLLPVNETASVEEMLDALAATIPEALVARLDRRAGEREERWAATLGGGDAGARDVRDSDGATGKPLLDIATSVCSPEAAPDAPASRDGIADRVEQLTNTVMGLTARLERLERELGL